MDAVPFMLVIVNVALVAAFCAEMRGVFDVPDERALELASMAEAPSGRTLSLAFS
jgi:hypothetical protein